MQVVYPRCCGIDVHKKGVTVCVLISDEDGTVERQLRSFGTMTGQLQALSEWLRQWQVTHLAMESTGVYWQPVYNLLEAADRTVLLVNAQHVQALPGRKTDTKDSEWLADLLRHGLLRGSFIPPAAIRELRELTRYRKTLVQERSREANRVQKLLEGANIKLAAVATNVLGVSGRQMLDAIIAGEEDPAALAEFARASLRKKLPQLRQALEGRVKPHHRLLLTQILGHIDYLTTAIAALEQEVERCLVPFTEAVTLLQTIPGIGAIAAGALIAEIGVDMGRFPSAKHLASWAGVCPGNRESAGKRLSGKTRTGNAWLRGILGEVAWAAARSRDTYFSAQLRRLARKRGMKRALLAVAHSVLTTIYAVLQTKQPYHELGPDYFNHLDAERLERHHVQRLEQLGYTVTLAPKSAAS
jgi:transposase